MPIPATVHQTQPRYAFDSQNGRLTRTTATECIVMLPWPAMKAFRWAGPAGPTACTPEFRIPPDRQDRDGISNADQLDGRHEVDGLNGLRAYCELIPAAVRQAVTAFRERHWQLLAWVSSSGPAAEQLLQSNPALAFAAACGAELSDGDPDRFVEVQARIAYRSQVKILERLGFPARDRIRRIFRKIEAGAISVLRLRMLREWLKDETIVRRLAHTAKVTDSVLALLEHRMLPAVDDRALHQLAQLQGNVPSDVADLLRETVRLWDSVRPTTSLPQFTGVDQVRRVTAELRQDISRVKRSPGVFPPPPVPGNEHILPIDSMAMLVEEGRLQSNCIDTYAPAIKGRRLAVYRILSPQRCTLALRVRLGRWAIGELKGTANSAASREARAAVKAWLKGAAGATAKHGGGD